MMSQPEASPRRSFESRFSNPHGPITEARKTFFMSSIWPDWCQVGVVVYDRSREYLALTIVEVGDTLRLQGGNKDFYVYYPEDLTSLTLVKPRSRWEVLDD